MKIVFWRRLGPSDEGRKKHRRLDRATGEKNKAPLSLFFSPVLEIDWSENPAAAAGLALMRIRCQIVCRGYF